MSLSPKEQEEIEAVAKALLNEWKYPISGPAYAARLRALLPKQESLEECVEAFSVNIQCFDHETQTLIGPWVARLRAALARRREGK